MFHDFYIINNHSLQYKSKTFSINFSTKIGRDGDSARILSMSYIIGTGHSSFRETRPEDRPREKISRLGAEALTDKELLMLLIGSGTSGRAVDEVAEDLLSRLDRSSSLSADEIMQIPGLGKAKASAIDAALELGRRRVQHRHRIIASPSDIFREIQHYASREQENLIVVMLNGAHEVIGTIVATVGLLNKTIVHPREVFADAIRSRAAAIVIAHNHPSGNIDPSEEDKEVTIRIRKAGEILGIKVLDHLVFTEDRYYSFLEHGLM